MNAIQNALPQPAPRLNGLAPTKQPSPTNRFRRATPQKTRYEYRTNELWIQDLSGANGPWARQSAHEDLAAYLYVVVLNCLRQRYTKRSVVVDLSDEDLAVYACDFIQDFMVKMGLNHYALLKKYNGTGRFTSWVAQIMHNLVASEFRRPYWRKETTNLTDSEWPSQVTAEEELPESIAIRHSIGETLQQCLERLPAHYRTVIERCILQDEPAAELAHEENVSVNSIYIRLHRAKERLRKAAVDVGLEANSLSA